MTVNASEFVEAIRVKLGESPSIAPEKEWVAGGVTTDGDAVVLYRATSGGPLLGRRWNLQRFVLLFGTEDVHLLADAAYTSEIAEPEGPRVRLDVDWAAKLVDSPSEVLWVGEPDAEFLPWGCAVKYLTDPQCSHRGSPDWDGSSGFGFVVKY